MDLVIVTGMSGAGKTQAINALEDLGYYCVDNVPPQLVGKFAELPQQSGGKIEKIAMVVDVRSRDMFNEYVTCMQALQQSGCEFKTLFLDAENQVLMRRYKETRRRHPLQSDIMFSMEQAIAQERDTLEAAKAGADFIIDTTRLTVAQMKDRVSDLFSGGVGRSMMITIGSFGFKHGAPGDCDLMFDVRCLPNPFYVPELRDHTGLEQPVRDYVLGFRQATELAPRLFDLIDYLIPLYIQEGKSQLVVAFGCTGGKHRSVVFATLLQEHLAGRGLTVHVTHRDISLPNKQG